MGPQPQNEWKVTNYPRVAYEAVTETGVTFITKEGEKKAIAADSVITATSPRPDTGLLKQFEGMSPEVYLIGNEDREPGTIMNAIGSAFRLAQGI